MNELRSIVRGVLLALLPLLGAGHAVAQGVPQWSQETLDAFATLPVQDDGRVKPMNSVAGLKLLTFNGKRKLKLAAGGKLKHDQWLLGALLWPDVARNQPCFRVQSDAVLTDIGLTPKGKRDWYSYEEIRPGMNELMTRASRHASIEAKERTSLQRQILKLASDVREFESLVGTLAPVLRTYSTGGSPRLAELFGTTGEVPLSTILRHGPEVIALNRGLESDTGDDVPAISSFLMQLSASLEEGQRGLTLIPPPPGVERPLEWWNLHELARAAFDGKPGVDLSRQLELLEGLEAVAGARGDTAAVEGAMVSFQAGLREVAEERGEFGHIPLEVKLYRWNLFTNALVLSLLGFLLTAASWMLPRSRWLYRCTWGAMIAVTAMVALGITMRCIIRERPPVVSLYDTILFVTGSGLVLLLLVEWITKLRIPLALATFFGVAGLFLASKYELKEVASAGDTMASVVAVLDTNYYLAIHVITITLGYAGGLVASLIAHAWILGRLFGIRRDDVMLYRIISVIVYGVLCFSLLFSIFGTIMGGIWANDSWGRFWGWDPKENGALLICIWQVLVLHARLGGYIRDRGLAVLSVAGGIVVAASWWGVNLLGVGLHSYGFTSGIFLGLALFALAELGVMGLAFLDPLIHRSAPATTETRDPLTE